MTDTHDGPQVFGATDDERRIVETLYRAIGGEPDLPDEVLAPGWEDIPSIPGQPPGPEGLKPHIKQFHACSFIEAFTDLLGQTPGRYRATARAAHD